MAHRNTLSTSALAAFLAVAAAGCSTMPQRRAEAPILPQQWPESRTTAQGEASLTEWWRGFNDPTLDRLVAESLASGPSVRLAALRVLEARATSRSTIARYLPQLSARAQGSYTEALEGPPLVGSFQGFVTGGGAAIATEDRQFIGQIGPEISWEVPLFSRIEASVKGGRATNRAAIAQLRGAQVTLAADMAQAYVRLRAAQNRAVAIQEAAALAEQTAAVLEASAQAGIAAGVDAADARRLAEATKARLPDALVELRQATNVIAVLRGLPPISETAEISTMLATPAPVPTLAHIGAPLAPADLLRARPDVAEAEAQVVVQAATLADARTNLLPSINIVGAVTSAGNLIGSPLSEGQTQLTVNPLISLPLFDWGQRLADVRANDSRFEQSLTNYRVTVANAVSEASDALTAYDQAGLRLESARRAEAASESYARGLRASYTAGIASLTDRLRADQQLIDARVTRIDAEATLAQAGVTLFRAFGGGPKLESVGAAIEQARVKTPSPD